MGKIYRALQRSGKTFYEKDVPKGALNENALTSMEKNALGRAGRYYRLKAVQKRVLSQNVQMPSTNQIDSRLTYLGLGKDQISQQPIKELNQSLHRIDYYIENPGFFLNQKFGYDLSAETDFKLNLLSILLERRMFVLESYDKLVGKMKNYDLRRLIKRISDSNVKASIEKIFNELQMKNSILKKEYQKIEKLRLNINSEQQKYSPSPEELTEKENKTSKYFPIKKSVTTLVMGTLLILIAFLIAVSSFVNISVPDILNSTFLIILGFFFGQAIGNLSSFKETQKLQ